MVHTSRFILSFHADKHEQPGETFHRSVCRSHRPSWTCILVQRYAMKSQFLICFFCPSLVFTRPQNNVGSFSSFSNFSPNMERLSPDINTQLSRTFWSRQDSFSPSFDSELDGLFTSSVFSSATGKLGQYWTQSLFYIV